MSFCRVGEHPKNGNDILLIDETSDETLKVYLNDDFVCECLSNNGSYNEEPYKTLLEKTQNRTMLVYYTYNGKDKKQCLYNASKSALRIITFNNYDPISFYYLLTIA